MVKSHDCCCLPVGHVRNDDLRDQSDNPAITIKFDNVAKSSDEGKEICQKSAARSEFLFCLIESYGFLFTRFHRYRPQTSARSYRHLPQFLDMRR